MTIQQSIDFDKRIAQLEAEVRDLREKLTAAESAIAQAVRRDVADIKADAERVLHLKGVKRG